MKSCAARPVRLIVGLTLLGLILLVLPLRVAQADADLQDSGCSGSYYTVRRGDTLSIIARRVGLSVAQLRQANPQAVRPLDLIYAGEQLCIPSEQTAPVPTPTVLTPSVSTPSAGTPQAEANSDGYWYQVKPGDTWNKISRATGVPVRALWDANPTLLNRRLWLYIGQRVWIPPTAAFTPTGDASALPTATASPAAETPAATAEAAITVEATVTATVEIAATPTAMPTTVPTAIPTAMPTVAQIPNTTPTPTPLPAPSATPAATLPATAAPEPAASATALPPKPADCPAMLTDYDEAVARFLNNPANDVERLRRSLILCRVIQPEDESPVTANITAADSQDVIVVLNDATAEGRAATGALLVFHKGAQGYTLAHKAAGQGSIALVKAADINLDKQFDLVYSDTSCGAHTCFGALHVVSWDGKAYASWIEDEPTIAGPEYTVEDVLEEGQGDEIIVHGGVIGSVGAGPQRAWTETYISTEGAPYTLFSQVYDASACLYHQILDANRKFESWALDGFDAAIAAYQAALADAEAEACGTIKDEVKTLQDFARFRLVVAHVATGAAADAVELAPEIKHTGLTAAAKAFLTSYQTNNSVIQACRDTAKLAEKDPTTWQFLADWGYANPSFTAQELCPLN